MYDTEKYGFYRDTFDNLLQNLLVNNRDVNKISNDITQGKYYASECIQKKVNTNTVNVYIVRYMDNKIFSLPILLIRSCTDAKVSRDNKMYEYYISFIKNHKDTFISDFKKNIHNYNQINSVVYLYNIIAE